MQPPNLATPPPGVAPPAGRWFVAGLLTLVAMTAITAGQLVWTANTLLRDEQQLARVVHGAVVREPLRSEIAPDLAHGLAETAAAALARRGAPPPGPRARQRLAAVADRVVAGPAFDAQLGPLIQAMAAWAVTGREDDTAATIVVWDAYVAELEREAPAMGRRLAALPPAEDLADDVADTTRPQVPGVSPTEGLRHALRALPLVAAVCYVVAFAAAVGAALAGRRSGRGVALAVLVPPVATLLVWAAGGGAGTWPFVVRAAAAAALPAAAPAAMIALAALLAASRRQTGMVSPVAPGDPGGLGR